MSIMDRYLKFLFTKAVLGQDIEKIKACIILGADVNVRCDNGLPLVTYALRNREILELFRAQPSFSFDFEMDVIYNFMKICNTEGLKRILNIPKLDPNKFNGDGKTMAHIAVETDKADSIECLDMLSRDSRVDWNIRNADGETPIMYTWKKGKLEMFKILMNIPTLDKTTFMQDTFNVWGATAPECPVCYEKFSKKISIFQCSQGHFVCEKCNQQIQSCPKCRGEMIGRAHDFEQFFQTLGI